jgi:hypothetical protein
MARSSTIPEADYIALLAKINSLGYDIDAVQKSIHSN